MIRIPNERLQKLETVSRDAAAALLAEAVEVREDAIFVRPETYAKLSSMFAATYQQVPELREPTFKEMFQNFAGAMEDWVKAGFPVGNEEISLERHASCSGCDLWDGNARFGLGKCNHPLCGCSKIKFWLATSVCPAGKWKR